MYLKKLKTEADTEIQLSSSKPTTAIFHKNVIYIQKNELIMIFKQHFTFSQFYFWYNKYW